MIEHRFFVPIAQGIPIGTSTKVVHKGCPRTKREALYVSNEADAYWCYCHGCGDTGHYQKTMQRIKVKAPKKTGWVPTDVINLRSVDTSSLHNTGFLGVDWVGSFFTFLGYSKTTQRIYIPDSSGSYLGMDTTGAANARWYSPKYKKLAIAGTRRNHIVVTSSVYEYLEALSNKQGAVLCMDKAAEGAALAELCKLDTDNIKLDVKPKWLSKNFLLNLRVLGGIDV